MKAILGIDVGSSLIKLAGFYEDGTQIDLLKVKSSDQVAGVFGIIGKFCKLHQIQLTDIKQIVLTGMGAAYFKEDIYDIPTSTVDEFQAAGKAGLHLSGYPEAYVVSIGTGTAFIRASYDTYQHIGGTGVGGGTFMGLAKLLLNETNFDTIVEMICQGNPVNVDLTMKDVSITPVTTLPEFLTASNLAKAHSQSDKNDIAAGIANLVLQTAGMMAVFACQKDSIKKVVFVGSLAELPLIKVMNDMIHQVHGLDLYVPEHALYATAIGAALHAK
jgi:type II pantothenate kinase